MIKTAAQIPKGTIKNQKHETNNDSSNKNVSDLLKLFPAEIIKVPL